MSAAFTGDDLATIRSSLIECARQVDAAQKMFACLCKTFRRDIELRKLSMKRVCGAFALAVASGGEVLAEDDCLYETVAAAAAKPPLPRLAGLRSAIEKLGRQLADNLAAQQKLTERIRADKGAEWKNAIALRIKKREAATVKIEQARHLTRQWLRAFARLADTLHGEARAFAATLDAEPLADMKRIMRPEILAAARRMKDVGEAVDGIR